MPLSAKPWGDRGGAADQDAREFFIGCAARDPNQIFKKSILAINVGHIPFGLDHASVGNCGRAAHCRRAARMDACSTMRTVAPLRRAAIAADKAAHPPPITRTSDSSAASLIFLPRSAMVVRACAVTCIMLSWLSSFGASREVKRECGDPASSRKNRGCPRNCRRIDPGSTTSLMPAGSGIGKAIQGYRP